MSGELARDGLSTEQEITRVMKITLDRLQQEMFKEVLSSLGTECQIWLLVGTAGHGTYRGS